MKVTATGIPNDSEGRTPKLLRLLTQQLWELVLQQQLHFQMNQLHSIRLLRVL